MGPISEMEPYMKHSIKAVAAGALAAFALGAQADPQISWTYSIHTTWQSATWTGGSGFDQGTQTQTDTILSWGQTGGSYTTQPGGTRSALVLSNAGTPASPRGGTVFTDNVNPAAVATVTHWNNPLNANYKTLSTATLQTVLTLTPLNPAADPPGSQWGPTTLTFAVNFTETTNAVPCVITGPNTSVCDDIFVLTQGSFNQEFDYGGYTYYVSFVPMSGPYDELPLGACTAAGAAEGCLGFWTRENEHESETFGLIITSEPIDPGGHNNVPEPGILGLVGLGLLGAVGASRRRRKS